MIHCTVIDEQSYSLRRLREFYHGLYTDEFPDADERESLENMETYLGLKKEGWYRENNYHILILEDDAGRIAGGIVADYFARSNVGVIEFVVVAPQQRGTGIGRMLLEEITQRFREDSGRAGYESLNGICGEVNDPYRRCDVDDHLDGFARLRMWDRFGFGLLDFPYVQPALSEGQEPVRGLGLMFRPLESALVKAVPALLVEHIVADYQIWAMRIPEPELAPEFQAMRANLRGRAQVALLDMRDYICDETVHPFDAVEIREGDSVRLAQFAAIYQEAFCHDETAVDVSEFSKGSRVEAGGPVPHHYWLWGLVAAGESGLSGMASFFSFPHCGFGGYLALSGRLRGRGFFRRFLRLTERRIVEVNKVASGWYVECEPDSTEAAVFKRCSFIEVPITYLQPRLHTDTTGVSDGKRLELLYKPFGRVYGPPVLTLGDLKRDLREILARIYYLDAAGVEAALARMSWPHGGAANVFAQRQDGAVVTATRP